MSNDEYLKLAKLAKMFAREIAGDDDIKFIQLYLITLKLLLNSEKLSSNAEITDYDFLNMAKVPYPKYFYSNPDFISNVMSLINNREFIVGGQPTSNSDFRDCIYISNEFGTFIQTGTLISPTAAITCAHTYSRGSHPSPELMKIFVGNDKNNLDQGEVVNVLDYYPFPEYRGEENNHLNDLCILILKNPVQTASPRKIASTNLINSAREVQAVGFGEDSSSISGKKNQVLIPVLSNACLPGSERFGCNLGVELVAGRNGACYGDSGGPIYVKSGNDWLLAGVTSRTIEHQPCEVGGIYVRIDIDKYKKWIKDTAGSTGVIWVDE